MYAGIHQGRPGCDAGSVDEPPDGTTVRYGSDRGTVGGSILGHSNGSDEDLGRVGTLSVSPYYMGFR
jgi:hypothetical protein